MKNLTISALIISFFLISCSKKTTAPLADQVPATEQSFRNEAPAPGPAKKVQIGEATTFKMENGLQVIVVENHKLPLVSFQMSLRHEAIAEGDKAGYASFTGQLLNRGTTSKSKVDIDEAIDFIGANFNTHAFGFFASSLTKHKDKLLNVVTDVLYNPTFPEEEFEKIKTQTLSALAQSKTDPDAMASNVAGVLNYGKDHAFGEVQTEVTINNIEIDDCKNYYNEFFRPNNAYLTIVGDITPTEARKVVAQYFSKWEQRPVKELHFGTVERPDARKIAFVNKDGAVQSVIRITHPIILDPGDPDEIPASVMNSILGGGVFSGRLMQNLREDKAYTYGARSSLSSNSIIGNFAATASVRNEVTDSSITEFLYELKRMRDEVVAHEDLSLVQNYMTGSFARSLESPQTIARFALNKIRYDLPDDYYETYLEKLNTVSVQDVQAMAQKYIHPDEAYIVVVGNKDEVADKLSVFDSDGQIKFYDYKGDEIKPVEETLPEGLTAMDVVDDYLSAIGGKEKLNGINSMRIVMSMQVMGQQMNIETLQKEPSKMALKVGNGQMVFQEQKFDGTKGMTSQMGQSKVITEGPELEQMKQQAMMFEQLNYMEEGYNLELSGIEKVDDESCYKILVTMPNGDKKTQYYSVSSSLLVREVQSQTGPAGQGMTITNDYQDYKQVEGILFPHTMVVSGMMPIPAEMKVETLEFNPELSDELFKVEG